MGDAGVPVLNAWDNFYVIVGSSSAALTGLMFVAFTLMPPGRAQSAAAGGAISAFSAPTVVHLCAVLLMSAIVSAPWTAEWQVGVAIGLTGLAGLVYSVIVVRRVRRQTSYQPVFEDWFWHVLAPLVGYVAMAVGGATLTSRPHGSLFAIGGASLVLLFDGIHNAWDNVVFIATMNVPNDESKR
jgi:hypothetical protein